MHDRIVRTGRWDLQKDAVGDDLPGMTLGIVGLGNTGRELARLVQPFAVDEPLTEVLPSTTLAPGSLSWR